MVSVTDSKVWEILTGILKKDFLKDKFILNPNRRI
jgi:hypothetical protein